MPKSSPYRRVWVIGDIHGMYDPLKMLVDHIRYVKYDTGEDAKLIFLGDYIDRGPCSREVVDLILSLADEFELVCLAGNHEDMMLQFLNGSELVDELGNTWFAGNGGQQTVCSFTRSRELFRRLYAGAEMAGDDFRPDDFDLAPKYRQFFDSLRYAHIENFEHAGQNRRFAFTHAGLFERANRTIQAAAGLPDISPDEQLVPRSYAEFHAFRRHRKVWLEHLHLWNRGLPKEKFADFIHVHGHTPTPALGDLAERLGDFDPGSCLPFVKFTSDLVQADRVGNSLVFNAALDDVIAINIDTGSAYGKALTALSLHPKDLIEHQVVDVLQARIDMLDRLSGQAIGFTMSFEPDHQPMD